MDEITSIIARMNISEKYDIHNLLDTATLRRKPYIKVLFGARMAPSLASLVEQLL